MGGFILRLFFFLFLIFSSSNVIYAQDIKEGDSVEAVSKGGDVAGKQDAGELVATDSIEGMVPSGVFDFVMNSGSDGVYKILKVKFIEGNAGFMSLVALALVIGLAFCIERIIYLILSEIDSKRLLADIEQKVMEDDIEGAKAICRDTRGPVASICYQGLLRISENLEDIERSVVAYGSVQSANLERGCSWITLCISMSPSLGFLGTVIGMVMAFEQIQLAGDISPTIVAEGMKVALITTIFGIIAALILQLFYNYILTIIERITVDMEESAISLLDIIMKYKLTR